MPIHTMLEDNYLDTFNPGQRQAVEYCDGPSLVIAGAGSGKTRVLTYKIAYLMQHGYQPWQLLALTFTNKAANEMKERIAKIVGDDNARQLWMGTFHSIFLRILRIEHERIGFSANFTIYDSADSKSLMTHIIKDMELDDKTYKPSTVLNIISNAKNRLITAEKYAADKQNLQIDARNRMPAIADLYKRYSSRCVQADSMDFDDILLYTYMLFENNPEVLKKWQDRFSYVMVDEYQDTNSAQHKIVYQLTCTHNHICVVGDDAQSIYSFRGANIDNILDFQKYYEGSKLFKLEQNYRSTQNIVNAANSLIGKNSRQIQKTVFSENEEGERLHLAEAMSDVDEGSIVINNIKKIKKRDHCEYSDFAILYRTNAQSRVFEEKLRKEGMPYKIYGGLSFYQRKEIKDIIAYYRLAINPNDEEALRRVINYPARGIGATTVQKISNAANQHETSMWSVIAQPQNYGVAINAGTAKKLQGFHDLIEEFVDLAQTMTAAEVGSEIVKKSEIVADIYHDTTPESRARQENFEELMNGLQDFCESRLEEDNENIRLVDYLSEVSLISDLDTDKGDDEHKVTLMTIHSAKGLEFNTVFVVGLEETLFPNQMASNSPREMEEERRLFYVAITRAKNHCYLTYAKSRYRYGQLEYGTPSRFLMDIDPQYVDIQSSMRSSRMSDDIDLPWKSKRSGYSESAVYSREKDHYDYDGYSRGSGYSTDNGYSSRNGYSAGSGYSSGNGYSYGSSYTHTPKSPATPERVNIPRPAGNFTRMPSSRPSAPASSSACSAGSNAYGIAVGKHIRHERFGYGEVLKIYGTGDGTKATIAFENVGQKQLLMKYARFTIED